MNKITFEKVKPNLTLIKSSLEQSGPFKGTDVPQSMEWLVIKLRDRVNSID